MPGEGAQAGKQGVAVRGGQEQHAGAPKRAVADGLNGDILGEQSDGAGGGLLNVTAEGAG